MPNVREKPALKPKIRFRGYTDAWEQRKLREIVGAIEDGDWIEKNYISHEGTFRIIQTGNIGTGTYLDKVQSAKYMTQENFNKLTANEIFPGDILISRLADPAGRTIIAPNINKRMVTAVDVAVIRPSRNYSSIFLTEILNTSKTLTIISNLATGSTRQRISRKNLEGITLKLPLIEEQQKIGKMLKKVSLIIASNQRKGEILRNLKKSLLQKMFVSKGHQQPGIRFSGYTDAWEQRKLKEIVTIMGGGTPKSDRSEFWDGKMVWFTPTEIGKKKYMTDSIRKITEDGLKHSSAKLLPKGTILFTSRASIGDVAITKTLSTTNQGFQSWIPEDGNSEFFYYLAQNIKPIALRLSSGSTFREISSSNIKNISVNIPSSKIEEEKIGKFLGVLDSTIASNQRKGEILQNLKKALLQKMFV